MHASWNEDYAFWDGSVMYTNEAQPRTAQHSRATGNPECTNRVGGERLVSEVRCADRWSLASFKTVVTEGQRPASFQPGPTAQDSVTRISGLKARFIMPQSLAHILVHLVFSTKDCDPFLTTSIRPSLHAHVAEVARNAGCGCYIDNQEEYHRTQSVSGRISGFPDKYGVTYDERYVWD
jgi:hypothetical protein